MTGQRSGRQRSGTSSTTLAPSSPATERNRSLISAVRARVADHLRSHGDTSSQVVRQARRYVQGCRGKGREHRHRYAARNDVSRVCRAFASQISGPARNPTPSGPPSTRRSGWICSMSCQRSAAQTPHLPSAGATVSEEHPLRVSRSTCQSFAIAAAKAPSTDRPESHRRARSGHRPRGRRRSIRRAGRNRRCVRRRRRGCSCLPRGRREVGRHELGGNGRLSRDMGRAGERSAGVESYVQQPQAGGKRQPRQLEDTNPRPSVALGRARNHRRPQRRAFDDVEGRDREQERGRDDDDRSRPGRASPRRPGERGPASATGKRVRVAADQLEGPCREDRVARAGAVVPTEDHERGPADREQRRGTGELGVGVVAHGGDGDHRQPDPGRDPDPARLDPAGPDHEQPRAGLRRGTPTPASRGRSRRRSCRCRRPTTRSRTTGRPAPPRWRGPCSDAAPSARPGRLRSPGRSPARAGRTAPRRDSDQNCRKGDGGSVGAGSSPRASNLRFEKNSDAERASIAVCCWKSAGCRSRAPTSVPTMARVAAGRIRRTRARRSRASRRPPLGLRRDGSRWPVIRKPEMTRKTSTPM